MQLLPAVFIFASSWPSSCERRTENMLGHGMLHTEEENEIAQSLVGRSIAAQDLDNEQSVWARTILDNTTTETAPKKAGYILQHAGSYCNPRTNNAMVSENDVSGCAAACMADSSCTHFYVCSGHSNCGTCTSSASVKTHGDCNVYGFPTKADRGHCTPVNCAHDCPNFQCMCMVADCPSLLETMAVESTSTRTNATKSISLAPTSMTTVAPTFLWDTLGSGYCQSQVQRVPGGEVSNATPDRYISPNKVVRDLESCKEHCSSFEWCQGIAFSKNYKSCVAYINFGHAYAGSNGRYTVTPNGQPWTYKSGCGDSCVGHITGADKTPMYECYVKKAPRKLEGTWEYHRGPQRATYHLSVNGGLRYDQETLGKRVFGWLMPYDDWYLGKLDWYLGELFEEGHSGPGQVAQGAGWGNLLLRLDEARDEIESKFWYKHNNGEVNLLEDVARRADQDCNVALDKHHWFAGNCVSGHTFGCTSSSRMYVKDGCRGRFNCAGGSVDCASHLWRYQECVCKTAPAHDCSPSNCRAECPNRKSFCMVS